MKFKIPRLKPVLVMAAVGIASLAGVPAAQAAGQPSSPVAHINALRVKTATWPELHVGDCQQNGGTLTLNSDGTASFRATTLTYHTHFGDVWHSTFRFRTSSGFNLFSRGAFDSPRMDDGDPPPHYLMFASFGFDPAAFDVIDIFQTLQHSEC
ncbi:hypothetical protein SAMN05421504_101521 [Amycolatopsis xylanica]|uniref:DUF6294 domain-containing protein n=1 Tax=Amycolatopsis xylanica TaxID=589385 RepID=A0A1H2TD30_9PSEU|nr:DUF6294 family protein [Amycolatopsis xylanica]SDW41605.1 hypothetical protein SAMN05421504_101521 [Amycolatopsis xylanica]